ncbi:DUF4259 domain-containing protein [Actinoplanes sp. NPDC026623]|uniref:DUF4259 domain-containing protein n=1 Tax=Actinoplanes sp. NPDC026623 TaxID=3155610 RepID=UPI0033FED161
MRLDGCGRRACASRHAVGEPLPVNWWTMPRTLPVTWTVAAAALVAARCPGGVAVDTSHGPSGPRPRFPAYLRDLAVDALDCVIGESSWPAEAWDESPDGPGWRRGICDLRAVVYPPQRETPFSL